jgi:hypothetical protein
MATQIDYQGVTEHCLNLSYKTSHQKLQDSVRRSTIKKTSSQFNCGALHTTSEYLPGGTGAIIMGHLGGDPSIPRYLIRYMREKVFRANLRTRT